MNKTLDYGLFSSLLNNLHSVNVQFFPDDGTPPEEFSERYCYHPVLQSCFKKETFAETLCMLPENEIWEIEDLLEIKVFVFRLDGHIWILGPFVIRPFREDRIRTILIANRIQASYVPSLQLYYSTFPLIEEQSLIHTVRALIRVFCPSESEFGFRRYSVSLEPPKERTSVQQQTRFDFQSIRKRYDLENRFLRMIEEGDTEHVLTAFDNMGIEEMNGRRYINAIYYVPETGLSMVRALSRKAAERGGAPLSEIHSITQRAIQASTGISSETKAIQNIHNMIYELTAAVRQHKLSEGHLTPPIRKAVSFLRTNYTQDISLNELADMTGFVPSYLSRQFKREVGLTVSGYIRKLRCEQAVRLLKETDASVSEISEYIGYTDTNYFIKVFRKEYGTSPGSYRKNKDTFEETSIS